MKMTAIIDKIIDWACGYTSTKIYTKNPVHKRSQNCIQTGGYITTYGKISIHGVCWNTKGNPLWSDSHTYDNETGTNYDTLITNLKPNTKYYIRAYAIIDNIPYYGDQKTFTTSVFFDDFENFNWNNTTWSAVPGKGNRGIYPDYQQIHENCNICKTNQSYKRTIWVKDCVEKHEDGLWLIATTGSTSGSTMYPWDTSDGYYPVSAFWKEGEKHAFCGQIVSWDCYHKKGFRFQYGRLDVIAKMPPSGFTYFPSIWLYNASETGWQKPEIDFEIFGSSSNQYMMGGPTNYMKFSLHRENGSEGGEYTFKNELKDFHKYTLIWTKKELKWYVDDLLRYKTNNSPNVPMLIICGIQSGIDFKLPKYGNCEIPTYTYIFKDNECGKKMVIKSVQVTALSDTIIPS